MLSEWKVGLSNSSGSRLANVIILYNSKILVNMLLPFAADAYKHETIFLALPDSVQCHLNFSYIVWNPYLLWKLINSISPFFVLFDIICPEFPLIIMSRFKPCNHRMLVCLFYLKFICPLIVLCLIHVKWFTVLL